MPAVSVIVPVYQVEPYIERCARSLFSQTLEDIEYLFIDDASTDRSLPLLEAVLAEYPARRPAVRILRMEHNSGQAAVRMRGIAEATGDYLIHCDSDDEVPPDAYRLLYQKAVEEALDIVTCDFLKEENGRWKRVCGRCDSLASLLRDKAPWNLVCRLVRRSLFEEALVPPVGNMGEDMVLTVQATLRARSTGYVAEPLYRYYDRSSSISKQSGEAAALARWESLTGNVRLVLNLLESRCGYSGKESFLVAFKYYSRHHLEKFTHIPRYYRLWRETFPEVDAVLLRTPGIGLETKFWFVMIHLRLYRPLKKLTGLFR